MKRKILSVICFFSIYYQCLAQEPSYVHYTTKDGLPSSEVHAVMQDSRGYMWFGTDNGISRFNGYEFENFSIEDGLPNKVVFKIYEDHENRKWFLHNENKISFLDSNGFHEYKYNHLIPQSPFGNKKGKIKDIFVDSTNNITISWTRMGKSSISNKGEYSYYESLYDSCFFLDVDKSRRILLFYIPKINLETNITFYFDKLIISDIAASFKINPQSANNYHFTKQFLDENKYIFTMGNRLYFVNNERLFDIEIPEEATNSLFENNNLWLALLFGKGAIKFNNFSQNNIDDELYLQGYTVTDIEKNTENSFWFTTLNSGVYYAPDINFRSYNVNNTLADNRCNILIQDYDGNLIICLNNKELYSLNRKNEIKKIQTPRTTFIRRLVKDGDRIFVANNYRYFTLERNVVKNFSSFAQSLNKITQKTTSAKDFCKIKDNDYLVAVREGFHLMKLKDRLEIPLHKNYEFPPLKNIYINDLHKIDSANVLAATYNGLYLIKVNLSDYKQTNIEFLGKKHSLLKNRIDEIAYNKFDNRFYLATKEVGLLAWQIGKDEIVQLNKESGLKDNLVSSIYCLGSKVLIGTKNGLNILKLKSRKHFDYSIYGYSTKNGLPDNEINDIEVRDSVVYLATSNGLCFFDINNLYRNDNKPPIYISSLLINEKDTSINDNYSLSYTQNNINIHYVGLAYKAQKDIQYKFRLLGSDTTWKFTKNREVRFPDLSSGEYIFEVMAQNEDGYWSIEPARVSFIIKPPYWKTWWFRSIIGIILLFLIWLVFQYRMRELKKRNLIRIEEERKRRTIEKNLTQTKQKLVTQQLNPHFLFNTMSSIQYMIINNQKKEAVGLLSKFARMMRQGLEYSRVEYALLDQSIEFFRNYIDLKSIDLEEKIEVIIDTSKIASVKDCSIPPMLIQPFIENAIIHGLAPKKKQMLLKLSFSEIGKNIKCIIEDNGIGRKQSAKLKEKQEESYKSFGVKIINETLEMMNDLHGENYQVKYTDLVDENNEARGTRVEIDFPKFKN